MSECAWRYKPRRVPMQNALVLPLKCVEDLKQLEQRLRELYQVEARVQCQALLTTEYRTFRHGLLKKLRGVHGVEGGTRIEAYLPSWHLCVVADECRIKALKPLVQKLPAGASLESRESRKRQRERESKT